MLARIFRPTRNTMQSGKAKTRDWVLEFAPASARVPDPLMGWTSTADMNAEVSLSFETREQAVEYASRHGIAFRLIEADDPRVKIKAYADNFAYNRKEPWTH
jgi:hypothetical protein